MPNTASPFANRFFWHILLLSALHFAAIAAMLLSARWIVALGGDKSTLGWFSASILPGLVCGALLAGKLSGRIREKTLILQGAALVACSLIALSQCSSLSAWLLLWRVIQGFGHGMVFASIFSLAAHRIPDARKAQGIGYIALTIQIGNLAGVSLAEWLLIRYDFPHMLLGAACLSGLVMLFALILPTGARPLPPTHPLDQSARQEIPPTRQILLAVSFFFVLGGSYGTVLQLIPLLVQEVSPSNAGHAAASPVLAAMFFTVAFCRLMLARLADGRHQHAVLSGSMALLLISTLGWSLASSQFQLVAIAIVFALGYGLLFPGLNGLFLAHMPSAWRSRASSWVVTAFDSGFFGMLLFLGPVAEHFGYRVAFSLLAVLQLVSGLTFLNLVRRKFSR